MLKSLLLLPVLGLFILPHGASANANTVKAKCEGLTPEVEVIPTFGHVEQDRSLRAVNLNSKDAWGDLMVDHIESKAALKPNNTFSILKPEKGTDFCVILTNVKILYKLDVTLKLVDDYPKDSCEYKETIAHAEQHIAVAKDFLAQTSPMLRDYIVENMNGRAGMMSYVSVTDQAEAKLSQTMNNILNDYSQYLQVEHKKAQRRVVDIDAEHDRLKTACPDWKHPQAYK